MESEEYSFSADQPLTNPEEDVLGYKDFARNLATSIQKMAPENGIVMALYGTWGTGKSSVLNFVQHYLREEEKNRPIIFPFNPWWFSDEEDLVRQFLGQLTTKLKGKDLNKLKKKIGDLALIASKIPLVPGMEAAEQIGKWLKQQGNLYVLKQEIHKLLTKNNQKILVIIDDIDRLSASQMRQMFRAIKSVANFPNVIYLLAFDKQIVANAIQDEKTRLSGQDYLEKIIQVPFELPLPSNTSLQSLFFSRLNNILSRVNLDENSFDKEYWANVFHGGIKGFLKTPRNVMQLTNALSVTYPVVHGEVNPVDFIAIETLRVFSPAAYDMVRKMPGEFTGIDSGQSSFVEESTPLDPWLEKIPEEQRADSEKLLKKIFPKFNKSAHSPEYHSIWRRHRMIRSEDVFPVYFRFAIPEGEIGHLEMQSYLNKLENEQEFKKLLTELSTQHMPGGTSRARRFLTLLEDYTENEIPDEHIPVIYKVFYDIGDILYLDEDIPRSFLSPLRNQMKISRILYQLGKRVDQKEKFNLIKECVKQGESLETISHEISLIGDEHKNSRKGEPPSPEEDRQVNVKQLKTLEQLALKRFRQVSKDGSLIDRKELDSILYRWKEWTDNPNEITDWIQKNIQQDDFLIEFINSFVSESLSQSMGSYMVHKTKNFDMKGFKEFINPAEIFHRAEGLLKKPEFDQEQKEALHLFVKEFVEKGH